MAIGSVAIFVPVVGIRGRFFFCKPHRKRGLPSAIRDDTLTTFSSYFHHDERWHVASVASSWFTPERFYVQFCRCPVLPSALCLVKFCDPQRRVVSDSGGRRKVSIGLVSYIFFSKPNWIPGRRQLRPSPRSKTNGAARISMAHARKLPTKHLQPDQLREKNPRKNKATRKNICPNQNRECGNRPQRGRGR